MINKFLRMLKLKCPSDVDSTKKGGIELTEKERKDIIEESLSNISISKILKEKSTRSIEPKAIQVFCEAFNKVVSEGNPKREAMLKKSKGKRF